MSRFFLPLFAIASIGWFGANGIRTGTTVIVVHAAAMGNRVQSPAAPAILPYVIRKSLLKRQ